MPARPRRCPGGPATWPSGTWPQAGGCWKTSARRSDAGASAGTYLALAALNRLAAPCSKLAFADWWKTTAGDRFTRIGASVLDHRRFWDAMQAVTLEQLEEISRRIALRVVDASGLDCS